MTFVALTDDHLKWREECHEFAADVMRPAAAGHDREEAVAWDVLKEARRRGFYDQELLSRMASDEAGLYAPICAEEFHWGCAGIALCMGATSGVAINILSQGTPEQIERWVPQCFGSGEEVNAAAYAATEAGAGSDLASLTTSAQLHEEEWRLDGSKVMIGNGGLASLTLVLAVVDPDLGLRGHATFVLPRGTPGLREVKKHAKLGVRASHTAEIELRGCRIPADHVLGGVEKLEQRLERARTRPSKGGSRSLAMAEAMRPLFAAGAIGIARAAYEWTVDHLRTDASDLLAEQRVQHALADVATEIDASRLLTWRAAWMARNGHSLSGGEGSMAKLKASEVAMRTTGTLMELVGPTAGHADCPLQKWFRDAKAFEIVEGTSQIQRNVIGRLQTLTDPDS